MMPSRQRAYQLRHQALGLCTLCARPLHPGSRVYCPLHLVQRRVTARQKLGLRAQAESGIGRWPLGEGGCG